MRAPLLAWAMLATSAAGCVAFDSGWHGCDVGGHSRRFLFPAPFDVDRGNKTLIGLGLDVQRGGTSISFNGQTDRFHARGEAADFRDPASNWTLHVNHKEFWALEDERQESPEFAQLQARSTAALETELAWFLPGFEKAYGLRHEAVVDVPAAMRCE